VVNIIPRLLWGDTFLTNKNLIMVDLRMPNTSPLWKKKFYHAIFEKRAFDWKRPLRRVEIFVK
jgi:hypothetical protein